MRSAIGRKISSVGSVLALAVGLGLGMAGPAFAEQPQAGQLHPFAGHEHAWRLLDTASGGTLQIVKRSENAVIAAYDLSGCTFCDGEEDNCAADGIRAYTHAAVNEPLVWAVCHVGAHSQRFMLFRPMQNTTEPIMEITGAYSVVPHVSETGIWVEADGYTAEDPKRLLHWPE